MVLVQDHPDYDLDFIRQHSRHVVDARHHGFDPSATRRRNNLGKPIQVTYTGVVPIVYKAQRTLLHSLINSTVGVRHDRRRHDVPAADQEEAVAQRARPAWYR